MSRRHQPTTDERVFVAGWCQYPPCGKPFVVRVSLHASPPGYHSETCRTKANRCRRRRPAAPRRPIATDQWTATIGKAAQRCGPQVFDVAKTRCFSKTRFPNARSAALAANHLGYGLVAYPCPLCLAWHYGNPVPPGTVRYQSRCSALLLTALSKVTQEDPHRLLSDGWQPVRNGT